jgi:selenocysteine lyase/cysteine desulfurase
MGNVEARMRALAGRLKTGLSGIAGVELKTNMQAELSGGVVKFKLRGMGTKKAYDALWERHRLSAASTLTGESEGVRFSPHVYNSMEQMDRAVAAVKELAG